MDGRDIRTIIFEVNDMVNAINPVMVIVGIFLTIVGIDYLIKTFFKELFSYHKKTNEESAREIEKIFDKFPEMMVKTINGVTQLEEQKAKERVKDFYEKKKEEKDIEDWSIKD